MADTKTKQKNTTERPPIIAVMGHIDHGKSALLDFIRKSNIVAGEAGGITQHISAYEVEHNGKKITFLDTPGHEAFTAMRARGASIADIAILIVSAEEGPKPQTVEAYKSIKEAGIPFVVAINKIDRPEANVEKVKQQLMESEIYVEGYGGNIPWAPISAKTGQGVSELLDTLLLVAEMEELKGDPTKNAEGFVLETNMDAKKGICVTLIITDGKLDTKSFIVSENKIASIRTIENFLGQNIKEATFSSPIEVVGFKEIPTVGSIFTTYTSKKEAEEVAVKFNPENLRTKMMRVSNEDIESGKVIIPLVIKVDVLGTAEAIQHEIAKIENDRIVLKIINIGVGNITENDVKIVGGDTNSIITGFNVKTERGAKDLAEKNKISIGVFNIIYKLTEWLEEEIKKRTPKIKVEKTIGKIKIIRKFSQTKDKQVLGGQVLEGGLKVGAQVKVLRRDFEIAKGNVLGLQSQKIEVKEVKEGEQFGSVIECRKEIAPGDVLEAFIIVEE